MGFQSNIGKVELIAFDTVSQEEFNRAVQMFTELGAGEEAGRLQLDKEDDTYIVRMLSNKTETADGLETLRGMFQEHVFNNQTTNIEDWHDDPEGYEELITDSFGDRS